MTYPLGVDIGTTYTAAALWRDGRVQTVPLGNRADAIPSTLFLRDDGTLLTGEAASRRGLSEPDRLAREFKRRMGDEVPILLGGHSFTAHELTGRVLRWTVDRVAELQGGRPSHVVLTHPAEWGDYRRNLLLESARAAGVQSVGLLPEPVAAATWYAAQERVEPGSLIGVYDFGGGTFDASVVRKTPTGVEIHGEAGGDDAIGGIDFDYALFRHVGNLAGIDVADYDQSDPAAAAGLGQLLQSVVDAKEALSADTEAIVPVLLPGVSRQVLVTRGDFEALIRDQVLGTVGVFGQVVRRAGVEPRSLHGVLLVGGSSRIPLVSELLASELGLRVAVDAHPKYTVSLGAAIAAAPRVAGPRPGPIGPVRPMPAPPPPRGGGAGGGAAPWPPPAPPRPAAARSFGPPQSAPPQGAPSPGGGPSGPGFAGAAPSGGGPSGTGFAGAGFAGAPSGASSASAAPSGASSLGAPPSSAPNSPSRSAGAAPAVSEPVDLVGTGLTAATDVSAVIAAIPPPKSANEPMVIRTRERTAESGRTKGRGRAILIAVVIVAILGVVGYLLTRPSDSDSPGGHSTLPSGSTSDGGATGILTASGKLVSAPAGADAMRAVVAAPSGDLVAVGTSLRQEPRAWVRHGGQWAAATIGGGGQGALEDVAVGPNGLVAVGWSGAGDARRPAVWTSPDGTKWTLVPAAADFAPGKGITELTAVTADGDRLLAAAIDRRTDRADGDVAVYSSTDGTQWTAAPATGLTGPGPQAVQRMVRTSGGVVAIGSALTGAHRGPVIWTFADGKTWKAASAVPAGSPALWAIAEQPGGTTMVCGSTGTADAPSVACWRSKDGGDWTELAVKPASGSATPLYLYGLATTGDSTTAVGVGRDGETVDAATWTIKA
ncbi:Hsp70 family protein [Labedaea rhizosphaerae]|uniref:Hsp70 family protein n=1 Tax=Labedaea rhizosphaerae TaxID=598644 RepID=UPI0014152F70|nr:Hsp70 family protein [Labedaea rhizosphaerae]